MTLAATIVLFAMLLPATILYCFQRRRISDRAGAFHLLIAAVACSTAIASIAIVNGARVARGLLEEQRIADDVLASIAPDPRSALTIAHQAPQFEKPRKNDIEAWYSWRNRLRQYLTDEVYELDLSTTGYAEPEGWLRRESRDSVLGRREFAIPAAGGDFIPAVLLLPADLEAPVPAIMFVSGHVDDGDSGLAQLVLSAASYQNSAARELALAGYATLTIELRGFGLRGAPEFPDHFAAAYNALLAGGFYKKAAFEDIKRALDLLQALPEVDPQRIGMSGASLGGELAVEYSALDHRIKAVSFHSHGGLIGPYRERNGSGGKQTHYCHIVPGSKMIMQIEDPFLMLAPRPTQGIRGNEQPFGPDFVATLTEVWSLMGNSPGLDLRLDPGAAMYDGHAYFVEPAIRFFDKNL